MSTQWFVVSTKPRREESAQFHLGRRGVTTFLPRIFDRFATRSTVTPLFPGYLFVHADLEAQFSDVVWTPGVRKLIGFGLTPTPLEDAVVEFLRQRVGPAGVLHSGPAFVPGDSVRVRRGPFEGLIGIIENKVSGSGRVRVLMELLRRQTRVELPLNLLERVSL